MAKNKNPQQRPAIGPIAAPQLQLAPAILAPQVPADEKSRLVPLVTTLERLRGSRVIVYWLTEQAKVSEGGIVPFYDQLAAIGRQQKIDLVLYTRGGDAEAPWRFVSLVREFCDQFTVLIPHRALSAGTLLAMGADEIVMTPLSVLGPIDPSRTHPLLPRQEGAKEAEPISVQDMRHAMQFVREASGHGTEMPYTPEAMAQIFTALFEKIHPLAIGAIEQTYALAKLIGTQCLSTHMDPAKEGPQIQAIVDRLCDEYKSHNYQIGRREARDIGLKAVDAPPDVEAVLVELYKFYVTRKFMPATAPSKGQVFVSHIGWFDSASLQLRAEAQHRMGDAGEAQVLGDQWVAY